MTLEYGDPDEYERELTTDEKRARTPDTWGGAVHLGHDVYLRREPERHGAEAFGFWHWCTLGDRWAYAVAGKHDLIADEPLHLEPSILWPCCGKHGFVRGGVWVEA
ncbi:hypothetical protein [Dactylosporangium sp. CA-139066]|uniref:hypothetical protein n=1 Tax=Dactylosporangium sp. CA-139066 TaxID=3239930 RepID=UPI003D8A8DF6